MPANNDRNMPAGEIRRLLGQRVPGDDIDAAIAAVDEIAALRAELASVRAGSTGVMQRAIEIQAEIERMRPVVKAAEVWRDAPREAPASGVTPLRLAVDAYREGHQHTTASCGCTTHAGLLTTHAEGCADA